MRPTAHPTAIEIQTISICNAKCVICPHPIVSKSLPTGIMPMERFTNIIDQISPSWNCRIIPYLNSEPLLDPMMIERLRYICEKIEFPQIELSTNVSPMTATMQTKLTGIPIKNLRLSIFGFSEKTHGQMMPGLDWRMIKRNLDSAVSNSALRKGIEILEIVMIEHPYVPHEEVELAQQYCLEHDVNFSFWGFLDRAGNVEQHSNNINRPVIIGCEQERPLKRMHITLTGEVIICCQDWRSKEIIGNIFTQELLSIWHSIRYNKYREDIYSGCGLHPELCARCKLSIQAL